MGIHPSNLTVHPVQFRPVPCRFTTQFPRVDVLTSQISQPDHTSLLKTPHQTGIRCRPTIILRKTTPYPLLVCRFYFYFGHCPILGVLLPGLSGGCRSLVNRGYGSRKSATPTCDSLFTMPYSRPTLSYGMMAPPNVGSQLPLLCLFSQRIQ